MTFESALPLAFIIVTASLVGLLIFLSARRRAAEEEELRQAASARGWQFEAVTEQGYFVRRWHGTTDGIAWTAESLRSIRRGKGRHRRRRAARWRTAASIGVNTPILCLGVPAGKEVPDLAVAQGNSWLAQMAQKLAGTALDMAVDMYFGIALGREVDAGALRKVPDVAIPGYILMAGDPDEAGRALARGLKNALADATGDRSSVLSETDRPWILITPSAVAVGRMEGFATTAELEAFVAAGIRLTRSATFGRPSPS
jgi:hypothetical protein